MMIIVGVSIATLPLLDRWYITQHTAIILLPLSLLPHPQHHRKCSSTVVQWSSICTRLLVSRVMHLMMRVSLLYTLMSDVNTHTP